MKVFISDLLFFMFQFHIPLAKLQISEHAVFTLPCRFKCSLNLSSEQQKVSWNFLEKIKCESFLVQKFWSAWNKSVHGWPNSPSWYINSWPYIVQTRVEPHCQLPSLLVHWSYRDRNTHAMLHKCQGVCQLKHEKLGLQIIALTGRTDIYSK